MVAIDLTAKVALVTGSARGIGYAIAERFLMAGAIVNFNDRNIHELRSAEERLSELYPNRVYFTGGDVGDPADARRVVRAAFDKFKRLDVLVNNAGVLRDNLIGMITQEEIADVFHNNLFTVIQTTQAAARLLARSKTSSIINISSIIGTNGNQGQLIYGASKAGVIGATLSSAKELASHGIRVNSIAPGFIRTSMTVGLPSALYDQRLSSIAMGRVGEPDDIANVALFLASDLSAYVTGQVIGVDGGMVI
jgi:3-oxoacyl-[acyl-carrier protein] reductase